MSKDTMIDGWIYLGVAGAAAAIFILIFQTFASEQPIESPEQFEQLEIISSFAVEYPEGPTAKSLVQAFTDKEVDTAEYANLNSTYHTERAQVNITAAREKAAEIEAKLKQKGQSNE